MKGGMRVQGSQQFQGFYLLGKGSYGSVYLVIERATGLHFVLKRIDLKALRAKVRPERQVEIMQQLDHPNVIRYFGSFVQHSELSIVMEYAEKGDLQQLLKKQKERGARLPESQITRLGREIAQGLKYLHSRGIVHRDIKPLNIFLDKQGQAKIGDLGISRIMDESQLQTRIGTPVYLAPEQVKYQSYDFKVDVWALGCLLYQCAALQLPFKSKNLIMLGYQIVNKHPKPLDNYSDKLNLILKKLLEKSPKARPSAADCLSLFKQTRRVTSAVTYSRPKEISEQTLTSGDRLQPYPQQLKFAKKDIIARMHDPSAPRSVPVLLNNLVGEQPAKLRPNAAREDLRQIKQSWQNRGKEERAKQQVGKTHDGRMQQLKECKTKQQRKGIALISFKSVEIRDSGFDRLDQKSSRPRAHIPKPDSPKRAVCVRDMQSFDRIRCRPTSAMPCTDSGTATRITLNELLRCKQEIKPCTAPTFQLSLNSSSEQATCPVPVPQSGAEQPGGSEEQKRSLAHLRREAKTIQKPSFVCFSYKSLRNQI